MYTEIENIYIEKFGIDKRNLTLEQKMELKSKAYKWALKQRKYFIIDISECRISFLEYLRGVNINSEV